MSITITVVTIIIILTIIFFQISSVAIITVNII